MPLSLANLVSNRAAAVIDFGNGNMLNVEYLPAAITAETLSGLAALGTPEGQAALSESAAVTALESVTTTLLPLLASWDLVDESGATLPLDAPTLNSLGLMNEWTLLNGILSAQGSQGKS